MTRLVAFQIIGGTKHRPITKMILSRDTEADGVEQPTRYTFVVCHHDGYFDHDSVLPSNEGDLLYFMPCREGLMMAESLFAECVSADIARSWRDDDQACYGEDRLFQRAQP